MDDGPPITRIPIPALVAVGLVYLAITCTEILGWGGSTAVKWAADSGWTLAAVLATAACLYVTLRPSPSRGMWGFVATGCASWLIGQIAWDYFDIVGRFPASPTLSDIGFLGCAPLILAGLVLGGHVRC